MPARTRADFFGYQEGLDRDLAPALAGGSRPLPGGDGEHFRSLERRPQFLDKRKDLECDLAPGPCLVVPLTGVEPVRNFFRGILSPLCLPIPP